jgi:hypothetical protein
MVSRRTNKTPDCRDARQLASSSATALAATKQLVSGAERAFAYDTERTTLMRLFTSADSIEGVAAFIEKRPANFQLIRINGGSTCLQRIRRSTAGTSSRVTRRLPTFRYRRKSMS